MALHVRTDQCGTSSFPVQKPQTINYKKFESCFQWRFRNSLSLGLPVSFKCFTHCYPNVLFELLVNFPLKHLSFHEIDKPNAISKILLCSFILLVIKMKGNILIFFRPLFTFYAKQLAFHYQKCKYNLTFSFLVFCHKYLRKINNVITFQSSSFLVVQKELMYFCSQF